MTGIPVRCNVAMTGEITLRGKVLPIGGVKEKVLAAHRAGITLVILPEENRKDLPDISEEVRKELDIRFVENMDDVLAIALERLPASMQGQGQQGIAAVDKPSKEDRIAY